MMVRYQAGLHYLGTADYGQKERANPRLKHLLSEVSAVTRISAWAAGCDGSPIALSTCCSARQCRAIQYFRLGRSALTYWPFNQRALGTEGGVVSALAARKTFYSSDVGRMCPFAGCDAPHHNPIHFATSCTSAVWSRFQAFLRAGVRDLLGRMVFMLKKAHGEDVPSEFAAARTLLNDQIQQWRTWNDDDYRHVVMRLLSCAPFSEHDVRDQMLPGRNAGRSMRASTQSQRPAARPALDMPLSRALGRLFDSVCLQRSLLRKWANLWCQWAYKHIVALAGHYNCSRGFDRDDVPCFNHRERRISNAAGLHEVDDLGQDAGDVGSVGDNSGSDSDAD